jgi:hypothetical protein
VFLDFSFFYVFVVLVVLKLFFWNWIITISLFACLGVWAQLRHEASGAGVFSYDASTTALLHIGQSGLLRLVFGIDFFAISRLWKVSSTTHDP